MAELNPEEQAAEVVEEVVERMFSAKVVGVGGFLLSVTSAAVGFVIAERKYRRKYEVLAESEIAEMREHFARKELAREEKGDLVEIAKAQGYEVPPASEIAEKVAERHVGPPPPAPVVESETKNIFTDQEQPTHVIHEWDYEQEVASRKNGRPYVIHVDEVGETGYEPVTSYTYYAGDDVLCDERDVIVDDRNALIGDENLDKFGHGSNDPVIVYIRNPEIHTEFEIIKSDKTYAEEVHGLKHADYPRSRRQRFDDE